MNCVDFKFVKYDLQLPNQMFWWRIYKSFHSKLAEPFEVYRNKCQENSAHSAKLSLFGIFLLMPIGVLAHIVSAFACTYPVIQPPIDLSGHLWCICLQVSPTNCKTKCKTHCFRNFYVGNHLPSGSFGVADVLL